MDTQVRDAADAMKDGRSWMMFQRPGDPPVIERQREAADLAMTELRAQVKNYENALRYVQHFLEQTYSPDEHNDSPGNLAYATVLHALEGGDIA